MACRCNANGLPHIGGQARPGELLPWTTLRGASSSVTIVAPAALWVDAIGYREAVFGFEFREYTSGLQVVLQTAPVDEEDAFVDLVTHSASSTSVINHVVVAESATVPLMRYVRWKITHGSTAWATTLRLFAAFKRTR